MADYSAAKVADFGKIIFIPRNHAVPALPDMNLLVLKDESGFQAICIDIEIDAMGDTVKNACNSLKQALHRYIIQMIDNYDGDMEAATKDIINVSFSQGEEKSRLFAKYLEIKHQHLLERLAEKRSIKSRREDFINACIRFTQIEPIRLNLILAATIA